MSHSLSYFHASGFAQTVSVLVSQAGRAGVDLFFLLSSYLITTLLLREERAFGKIDLKAFYIRRTLRIWPLYFAALILMMGIVPRVFAGTGISAWYPASFAVFLGNWSVALLGWPATAAAPLWSVSVEEQFYILWPLVLWRFGVSRIGIIACWTLAAGTVFRVIALGFDAPVHFLWCATPLRMEPIALGALIAVHLDRHGIPALRVHTRVLLCAAGMVLAFACSVESHRWFDLVKYPVVAVACGMILVSILRASIDTTTRRGLFVYLGTISYGLYVFHEFVITATARLGFLWLGLPATILAAVISYHLWERPFLRLKERFTHVQSRSA